MVNMSILKIIRACLLEVKEQLEAELNFSDPKLAILDTIKAEHIYNASEIRAGLSKNKIKVIVLDYVQAFLSIKTSATRSTKISDRDFSERMLKDAGVVTTELERAEKATPEEKSVDEPIPGTSRIAEEEMMETEDESGPFDDELLPDPLATELSRQYPALPRTPCPQSLFVGNMRYKYLNSLFTTDRISYPKNWNSIKNNSPEQAWHSLNQTMIPFLNGRWEKQGVHIGTSETPVDTLSYYDLKSSILQAIREQTTRSEIAQGTSSISTNTPGTSIEAISRLDRITTRLEETTRVLTSHTTKVTGREVANPSSTIMTQPRLIGGPPQGTVPRPQVDIQSDSDEDIILG